MKKWRGCYGRTPHEPVFFEGVGADNENDMQLTDLSPERLALLTSLQRQARVTGHEIVARRLKSNGVTHVYGISGTPIDETLVACGKCGIRVIATRHQQAAVQAAAAHNYLAGELKAAVIVSAGPGVSNCTTGITVARDNHWPLLVIGGCRPLAMREMGSFQELDGVRLFESITKKSSLVKDVHELGGLLDQSCRLAMQGQPGPCYLDIAVDALNGAAEYPDAPLSFDDEPEAVTDWSAAVTALRQAHRPVLIVGEDLRWGDPWEALAQLVDTCRIPFVTSPMARGYLPDSHVLCSTRVRSWLLGKADLILMAGASLNWVFRYGAEIHPDADLVRLAFENDHVFKALNRGVEYLGNPAKLLRQLADSLRSNSECSNVDETWLRDLALHKQAYQQRLDGSVQDSATPLTPSRLLRGVAAVLPEKIITILDGNITMAWAQHLLDAELPLSRLGPGVNGCMGVGVPFALAASVVSSDRPVLAISGDFALGLSIMDLETAVRHRLPLVIIVANNSGSGGCLRQKTSWPADYPERICQYTPGIRYDQIMQALGGDGVIVGSVEQLAPALERAFASARPTLIQIDTRDDIPLPSL